MTSSLRDAILAALVEPRTRDELAALTATAKPAVCEAVSILIARGAVREVGPGPIHRLELVADRRPTMLEELRALSPADRAIVVESSAAVARDLVAEVEAARQRGGFLAVSIHTCDVLGIATALIFTAEQLAARDRALAAWETAAHLAAPEPPTPADRDAAAAELLDDDAIRRVRDEARFAGDHETARLCCAALGLATGDGARGLLDRDVCRKRLAAILNPSTATTTASKDPAP